MRGEVGLVAGLPVEVHAPIAQEAHREHAGDAGHHERHARIGQHGEQQRASQARHRIEVRLLEDAGRLAHADVAHRAAAHRRDGAEDDRQHEPLLERERLAGTGQREQSHRQRVGEEHHGVEVLEQPAEVEHEHAQHDAQQDKVGVRREVHALVLQQHIADNAAAVARDQAQHHRADDIQLAVAREQRAGEHAHHHGEVVDAPRHREHLPVRERRAYEFRNVHARLPVESFLRCTVSPFCRRRSSGRKARPCGAGNREAGDRAGCAQGAAPQPPEPNARAECRKGGAERKNGALADHRTSRRTGAMLLRPLEAERPCRGHGGACIGRAGRSGGSLASFSAVRLYHDQLAQGRDRSP